MSAGPYLPDADRNRLLAQALQICRLLAFEELSLHEIADRLGISTRTVRRYIYALRTAGIDIVQMTSLSRQQYLDEEDDYVERHARLSGRAHSDTYRLDRRAWNGALFLPRD